MSSPPVDTDQCWRTAVVEAAVAEMRGEVHGEDFASEDDIYDLFAELSSEDRRIAAILTSEAARRRWISETWCPALLAAGMERAEESAAHVVRTPGSIWRSLSAWGLNLVWVD